MQLHYLELQRLVLLSQQLIRFILQVNEEIFILVSSLISKSLSGEISRQFTSSKPKLIFTLSDIHHTIETAKELSKQQLSIVTIKTSKGETTPSGTIDFTELISTKGKVVNLIGFLKYFEKY